MSKREFVIAVIITCIVILAWIASDIYHAKTQQSIDQPSADLLEPVDPNFDLSVLNQQSPTLPPVAQPAPSSTPTPSLSPSPSPSPSITPSPTLSASSS